jgi:hypothetical protein
LIRRRTAGRRNRITTGRKIQAPFAFEPEKQEVPGEWGFLNELDRDVQKIGYRYEL